MELEIAQERVRDLENLLREALAVLVAIEEEEGLEREEYKLIGRIQAALLQG